jgi:ribosome biogenesis GTPase A
VSPIKNREALVVKLVDIFDFYGSFVPTVRKFTGTNPVILAATKVRAV